MGEMGVCDLLLGVQDSEGMIMVLAGEGLDPLWITGAEYSTKSELY